MSASSSSAALQFNVTHTDDVERGGKARVARMRLPHNRAGDGDGVFPGNCRDGFDTPIFMPVGTQGTLKGLTSEEIGSLGTSICLSNTYHLGHRPGPEVLEAVGGVHRLMNYGGNMLTDSGGFQMVSLLQLASIDEEGVRFVSPHNGEPMLLTPEHSIHLQNVIGADVIMQLDDVVHSCTTGERVAEAMQRSVRWLDRCIAAHRRPHDQNLFAIIQGGLNLELRRQCIAAMVERDLPGYAIGGLSGGESKELFWRVVALCTDLLPRNKPRYLMGVGYAVDLVVCSALGVDMFDCVYPSRTARFGTALARVVGGTLNLKKLVFRDDLDPVDPHCDCSTCRLYTKSYLHRLFANDHSLGAQLLTVHNIAYQHRLMADIRAAIKTATLPQFIDTFFRSFYGTIDAVPSWCIDALNSVNIVLSSST